MAVSSQVVSLSASDRRDEEGQDAKKSLLGILGLLVFRLLNGGSLMKEKESCLPGLKSCN